VFQLQNTASRPERSAAPEINAVVSIIKLDLVELIMLKIFLSLGCCLPVSNSAFVSGVGWITITNRRGLGPGTLYHN
jgi:hypothetical protein